jgi:hypothetical protein
MEDEHYIPSAFFVFESYKSKSDLRVDIAHIVMNALLKDMHIMDRRAITPWKIGLYHIREFEVYYGEQKNKHLKELKELFRWDSKPADINFMSPGDVGMSRHSAQSLLEKPITQFVLEKAKWNRLKYILHGAYDNLDSLIRVEYKDDKIVYNTLQKIESELVRTKDIPKDPNFNKCFYAYTVNKEMKFEHPVQIFLTKYLNQ